VTARQAAKVAAVVAVASVAAQGVKAATTSPLPLAAVLGATTSVPAAAQLFPTIQHRGWFDNVEM